MKSSQQLIEGIKVTPDLEAVVAAVSRVRITTLAKNENTIHAAIAAALTAAGIDFMHEVKLGLRRRVDFLTAGGTMIEVKHRRIDAKKLLAQLNRYVASLRIAAIVVVIDAFTSRLPSEISGKPLRQVGLNALHGVAI